MLRCARGLKAACCSLNLSLYLLSEIFLALLLRFEAAAAASRVLGDNGDLDFFCELLPDFAASLVAFSVVTAHAFFGFYSLVKILANLHGVVRTIRRNVLFLFILGDRLTYSSGIS